MAAMNVAHPARRGLLAGGGAVLAGAVLAPGACASPSREIVTAYAIHQVEDFAADVGRVYGALIDAGTFAAFSGEPASIEVRQGGAFSLFGGRIVGRNIEIAKEIRIVQAWRAADWPDGLYSIARFALEARNESTRLTFDHTGFPPGRAEAEHLLEGWNEHYWGRLRRYLA